MNNNKKSKCACSCCEDELKNSCFEPEFCEPCKVEFVECKSCGQRYSEKIQLCPKCGAKYGGDS